MKSNPWPKGQQGSQRIIWLQPKPESVLVLHCTHGPQQKSKPESVLQFFNGASCCQCISALAHYMYQVKLQKNFLFDVLVVSLALSSPCHLPSLFSMLSGCLCSLPCFMLDLQELDCFRLLPVFFWVWAQRRALWKEDDLGSAGPGCHETSSLGYYHLPCCNLIIQVCNNSAVRLWVFISSQTKIPCVCVWKQFVISMCACICSFSNLLFQALQFLN